MSQPQQATGPRVLKASRTKRLTSHDGGFSSRALFPFDEPRRVEHYELILKGGCTEEAEAHAPGTRENLAVSAGTVDVVVDGTTFHLDTGDALTFEADVPHAYRNPGQDDAVMYLVMTYVEAQR